MSRTNSLRRYTQSIGPKVICILLVNADYICRNIVADMLQQCRYEAFSYEREMDALNIILEKKDAIELILTNVHRTYASRCGIVERIEKEFKLQIILMSPDDDIKNSLRGGGNGVTVYFIKSLSLNEMNNLWATALARQKSKSELSSGNISRVENAGSQGTKEDSEQNGNTEKKPRVVWTKEMHQKFLEAVEQLGHDKAFPKKIVELMNVPGLTRENVASHLQKYRMCMKRAQEGFTASSFDFNDPFGLNTSQHKFQQLHWNPFQTGSSSTTATHFGFNTYKSTSRTPQHISLLNTIQLKPDHNLRVYGDEKKNVLLSIEDSRVQNTSFAGFRLTHDGKSVVFGQNSHFGSDGVSESYFQSPPASLVQQQSSCPEIGNGVSTHCTSFIATQGTGCEPVTRFSSQMSSLAALLAVNEPMPAILPQPQPSAAPTAPVFDWNKVASFIQPPSSVSPPWLDWEEPLRFTCEQPAVTSQPQSAGLQWTNHWAEPSFSPQQPPSGNITNASSEIFSDFSSSLPPEFCELGLVGDENGVDATEMSVFDDLLFDNQDLT